MIRCLERLQNGPIQKRKISSVYLLFHSVSGTCSSSDFYYHGRKGGAIYAAVTYIVYGMLYTVVNLSYGSLSTVMTTNPEDISQLTSWRMMGTNLSSVVLSALSPVIMGALSGGESFTAKSYLLTIIIYAACSIPLFYFVYANCKEVVKPVNDGQKVPLSMSLKAVVSNKPLMLVFGIQLFAMFAFLDVWVW